MPWASFFLNRSVLSALHHVGSEESKGADLQLTQEEDKVHVLQQLVRAYLRKELN